MNQVWDANKKQPHGSREHFRLKRKKKTPTHSAKSRDAAVKNSNIGSSRKPPRCIHY